MKRHGLIAGIILVVSAVIALTSVWHDSPIVDEIPHIGSGYSYVAGRTYQLNPEHPPLAKDVAGIALMPLKIDPSILASIPGRPVNDQWNFGQALIYRSGTDASKIVHAAKLPMMIFFIFAGVFIFLWTKKYYNSRAAILAVFLFSFCPTIIAHARFVTTDVPALFGVLLATYFFFRWLREPSRGSFWLAALSFGVALLTKFSTFLLAPYFLIIAVAWVWTGHRTVTRPILKSILVMLVGFIIVVGPIYQLHLLNYPAARQKTDTSDLLASYGTPTVKNLIIWAADKPILRPYAEYGLGLAMVSQRAEGGNRTYFQGKFSNQSFKSYFPIVFALKEPIPFLILILGAVWLGMRAWFKTRGSLKQKVRDHFPEFVMLLWIAIYMATSVTSNLNIGIRHLIPIYGFIFILVAGQIEQLVLSIKYQVVSGRKYLILNTRYLILGGLLAWYLLEFVSVYPYYLTYFNQFAGGPSGGHNHVVDSNLDWGQDLWRLADYVKENNISKIYLDYFGWADQTYYLGNRFQWIHGGDYASKEQFLSTNPAGGWLGVSATYSRESMYTSGAYRWLARVPPTAVIGNSIFVWHITP